MTFAHPGDSHKHSLEVLNHLYEYDEFMASISSLIDLGSGTGEDLEWWATRTTRDEVPIPLNIKCTGVDLVERPPLTKQYSNISYQQANFEGPIVEPSGGYDILWCHDAFQYAVNPLETLSRWWNIASTGALLYISIPVTQRVHQRDLDYQLPSGCYYHHTMISLIYMLATNGWDCRGGFFKQQPNDPWIHAVVYKSDHPPLDPKVANWYTLAERKLLPDTAERSVYAHGHLRQQDLVVPWLNRSLMSMALK